MDQRSAAFEASDDVYRLRVFAASGTEGQISLSPSPLVSVRPLSVQSGMRVTKNSRDGIDAPSNFLVACMAHPTFLMACMSKAPTWLLPLAARLMELSWPPVPLVVSRYVRLMPPPLLSLVRPPPGEGLRV